MSWEETMWAELAALSDTDQIVTAGEWIAQMTKVILPGLAAVRREKVLQLLAEPEWDATRLAETIGSRRSTITRLAEEGRAQRREENLRVVTAL